MGLPSLPFARYLPSRQMISGLHMNYLSDMLTSFNGKLTALAGGGLSGLTPVFDAAYNEVTTVANAADSFVLPIAKVGLTITVTNSGAQSMQVFANGTDTISGTAGNVGVAQAAAAVVEYSCVKNGVWKRYTAT